MNYTPDQLRRRNESLWTPVQAVTAPVQFLTFIASLILVIQYFATGQGYTAAHIVSSIKVVMMVLKLLNSCNQARKSASCLLSDC